MEKYNTTQLLKDLFDTIKDVAPYATENDVKAVIASNLLKMHKNEEINGIELKVFADAFGVEIDDSLLTEEEIKKLEENGYGSNQIVNR